MNTNSKISSNNEGETCHKCYLSYNIALFGIWQWWWIKMYMCVHILASLLMNLDENVAVYIGLLRALLNFRVDVNWLLSVLLTSFVYRGIQSLSNYRVDVTTAARNLTLQVMYICFTANSLKYNRVGLWWFQMGTPLLWAHMCANHLATAHSSKTYCTITKAFIVWLFG